MNDEICPANQVPDPAAGDPAPRAAGVRAAERLRQKARTQKRIARREACFELMSAGYGHHEIAKALKVSVASVRRDVDKAIDKRRLAAPERYIHLQVDRLTRALRSMDDLVERGDARAVKPFLSLVGALDRYHGLGRLGREANPPAPLPARQSPLALAAPAQYALGVAESDTQAIEKIG